jgi:hypothetical protein
LDFKDFHDGVISLSLVIFIFSITLIIGSIILDPYIGIPSQERDIIVILCSINIFFSLYYLWNVIRLEKIYRLETKNIIRFAKIMGIVTIIYLPHVIAFIILFLMDLHNLVILMISLIILMEIILIIVLLKEVYDLVFLEKSRREANIEADRRKYIEQENN